MVSNDSGFSAEPPKDAEGNVIPFDTDTLYGTSGQVFYVTYFHYSPKARKWFVGGGYTGAKSSWCIETDKFLLAPPDSWDKLEEDAMKHSCEYFGVGLGNASCGDCPHGSRRTGRACWANVGLDMIARAKKLAGVEEREG